MGPRWYPSLQLSARQQGTLHRNLRGSLAFALMDLRQESQVHSTGIARSGPCDQLKAESELGTRTGSSLMIRGFVPLMLGVVLATSAGCKGNPPEETCGPINSQCAALATDTCSECMSSCCCQEMLACNTNTSCGSLGECMGACNSSDTACIPNCTMSFPDGESLLANVATCGNSNCSSACQ